MNKKLSMFASAGLALILAATPMMGVSAVKPVEGKDITVKRTVTSNGMEVSNTYGYSVTYNAGESEAAEGYQPTAPKAPNISFSGAKNSGNVSQTATIDFGSVDFTKVGQYSYDIKEVSSTDSENYPINKSVFKVVAIVTNSNAVTPDGKLSVKIVNKSAKEGGIEFKDEAGGGEGGGSSTKRTYLQVSNKMTGDGADLSKCVSYTLDASNLPNGEYKAEFGANTCSNKTTFTKSGGSNEFSFKLKNGETMTFGKGTPTNQLLLNKSITIKQESLASKGYTTDPSGLSKTITTVSEGSRNVAAFTNSKTFSPKTGIPHNFAPYLLVVIAGAAGAGFVAKKRKENR